MLSEKLNEAQQEYGAGKGSERFAFQKGDNKIRLLNGVEPIATHFIDNKPFTCLGEKKGCQYHGEKDKKASVKFVTYILDRTNKSDEPTLAFLPWTVIKEVDILQKSEDYNFEQLPMPYDITVKYNPDADPNGKYKVIPSPKREPVLDEVMEKVSKLKTAKEIVNKIKSKVVVKSQEVDESTESGIDASDLF